jgi:glucuronate isomerase
VRGDTGEIHDAARAARGHRAAELLAWNQRAADEIQVEVRAPIVFVETLERPVGSHCRARIVAAGGIHEGSRITDRIDNLSMSSLNARPIDCVNAKKFRDAPDLANRSDARLAARIVSAEHRDGRACRRKSLRDCAAQRACRANNDRHLPGQIKWIFHVPTCQTRFSGNKVSSARETLHAKPFLDEDFLLDTPVAVRLYRDCASQLPIVDYHSHLPVAEVAKKKRISNIGELWLADDHYKWRLMRMAGVPERLITGDADDREKFYAFCRVLPQALGNPVHHWCHLELKHLFQIESLINESTASSIWDAANSRLNLLNSWSFLENARVEAVCTTDDPADDLTHHAELSRSALKTQVLPTFRPDRAMRIDSESFPSYLDRLGEAASTKIKSFATLILALDARVEFFHSRGARVSDHSIEVPLAPRLPSNSELEALFERRMENRTLDSSDLGRYQLGLLTYLGRLYARRDWAMCLHIGARRNNNTRAFEELGPDTGFDSIGDVPATDGLALLLDTLDHERSLPKTILFCMNPAMNEILATMAGNFCRDSIPGKVQFGPPWWFNDHKQGILAHFETLASYGLLGTFIGMTTDSRSFASYPRHEYFRRLLCRMLGRWLHDGECPDDEDALRRIVEAICYTNAKRFFSVAVLKAE